MEENEQFHALAALLSGYMALVSIVWEAWGALMVVWILWRIQNIKFSCACQELNHDSSAV